MLREDQVSMQPDPEPSSVARLASFAGVAGSALLMSYFVAPMFLGWPYAGAPADAIAAYARAHQTLFFGGAWLQVTGTFLSVGFFVAICHLGDGARGAGSLAVIVASTVLVAVVVIEAAFLIAVPIAASANDSTTSQAMFTLSNGVFLRVFPLGPAPATLTALGAVIVRSHVLDRTIGRAAIALGAAFELAGIAAIFSPVALPAIVVLSVLQAVWIIVAAASLGRTERRGWPRARDWPMGSDDTRQPSSW
jgi:hypothetical protein